MGDRDSDTNVPTWGTSLPVDNVQEMVKRNPSCVLERYILDHNDRPNLSPTHASSDVPIIDLSLLSNGDEEELKKLDRACIDWGFFQLINHGIAEELLQRMKDASSKFFNLTFEERNKYAMTSDDIHGYGQAYVVSEEQKLDWSDALILSIYPLNFRKPKFWPTSPPELKDAIEMYSQEVSKISERLFRSLSLVMGLGQNSLLELHKEPMQFLRVNYYPTCSMPDHVLGVSPHSDTSSITILMQDDDVTGLQIHNNGDWVSVRPIPNALVINIGDVIEIWSNGKYKSIEHRVVANKNKARMSFASFITPNQDVEIEPVDEMVHVSTSLRLYKKIKYGEYLRASTTKKMEGKAHTKIIKVESE
ncbi:hypothetical protein ACHQM5_001203 [Ranunculus cassubicifolius]